MTLTGGARLPDAIYHAIEQPREAGYSVIPITAGGQRGAIWRAECG
jgi:hypothetical protein